VKILAGIFEPQVLANEQKDQYIQFFICLFNFNGRKQFLTLKLNKQIENEIY